MKKCFKGMALSLLISSMAVLSGGCSCNGNKVKITFVTEGNSDIVKYVKKGQSLVDVPEAPPVKGKYCVWDQDNFQNIEADMVVTAECFSTVTELRTNLAPEIDVKVATPEADLAYILKDLEMEATFESGEKKIIYDEYTIEDNGYNKNVGGTYIVSLKYNNAKQDIKINVRKESDYVTVFLDSSNGYFEEGLPNLIVNSEVEGSVSFDAGQETRVGIHVYNWTFVPKDKERYEIVHGEITVDLITAKSLLINKGDMTVAFGTSKNDIIKQIKKGLVVQALHDNSVREISDKYYSIDCEEFISDASGDFMFKVDYMGVSAQVKVTVEKNDTYPLVVHNIDEYIVRNNTFPKLSELVSLIQFESDNILGVLSFEGDPTLILGSCEYEYTFTPNSLYYASRKGKITINAYKAQRMEIEYSKVFEYDYGTPVNHIREDIKAHLLGKIIYNEDMVKNITLDSITVRYDEGNYFVNYNNGEIEQKVEVKINKIVLEQGVDFVVDDDTFAYDENNDNIVLHCEVKKVPDSLKDFDINEFEVIQIGYDSDTKTYTFELIPSDTNKFETIIFNYVLEN